MAPENVRVLSEQRKGDAKVPEPALGSPDNYASYEKYRETKEEHQITIMKDLAENQSIPYALFPISTDVLLSIYYRTDTTELPTEIKGDFMEYFSPSEGPLGFDIKNDVHRDWKDSLEKDPEHFFPPSRCLPFTALVKLKGTRADYQLPRLFIGDLVWLFFYERMGIFQMLKCIIEDFSENGKWPIPIGDSKSSILDTQLSIILETMVREYKLGMNSTVRDRDSTYRRCLGWSSKQGSTLTLRSLRNCEFTVQFHTVLRRALSYYKDKRIAVAIRGAAAPSGAEASVETLTSVAESIDRLRQTFDRFKYNRNYSNTLSGIVWNFAALSIISLVKNMIGVPKNYIEPYQYIPAIYDIVVPDKDQISSNANRYSSHRECARAARNILIEIELNPRLTIDTSPGKSLDIWLGRMEEQIEKYRTEYKNLTNIDVGKSDESRIQQSA